MVIFFEILASPVIRPRIRPKTLETAEIHRVVHNPTISVVIGLSMMITFTWAGLVGILAPLTLKRFGADPAVASSVFVLTTIDMASFFVFLGLASLMLL